MMVDLFLQNIIKQRICNKNDRVLVAVSGGIDSMVLFDLFVKGGYQIGVAHCNFRLRGEESDRDEEFVKLKAAAYNVPFYCRNFNTKEYANDHKISIQMAARELRYTWFETIRQAEDYDYIATAHHHDDHIETTLFNLIKGSGLAGLSGIPVKNGKVIRPLLFALRSEIENYASLNQIDFRLDRSNLSADYHRNFIRQEIIPKMQMVNPAFSLTSKRTLARLNGIQNFLNSWFEKKRDKYLKIHGNDLVVDKQMFREMGESAVAGEFLRQYGFNFEQADQFMEHLEGSSGKTFFSDRYVLNIDRKSIIISPLEENKEDLLIREEDKFCVFNEGIIEFNKVPISQPAYISSNEHLSVDLDKITFPLRLRNWKKGDWFIPLGMKGKKKLSDFMIDNKIPLNLKKRVKVLESNQDIICILGYRIDERYKITESTEKVLNINLKLK